MLDERKAAILRAVIEEYIDTAQPVGSSTVVATSEIQASPATVRNEMGTLESEGYLVQPHTSAGRVPTDKGYRYFVDHLGQAELSSLERRRVSDFFTDMRGEIEGIMKETAGLLANLTDYAAVVVDDAEEAVDIRSVQLVSLSGTVVLAIVVLANGQVAKHTIDFTVGFTEDQLSESARLLSKSFDGRPVSLARALESSLDPVADQLAQLVYDSVAAGAKSGGRVYVDGTAKVANAFQAVESVGRVLTILEQQLIVVSLLADVVDRGLTVAIGSETGVAPLAECSLVVAPYEIDGEHAGSLAVLGPTRMKYQQTLSAVAAVSLQLGNSLSEG